MVDFLRDKYTEWLEAQHEKPNSLWHWYTCFWLWRRFRVFYDDLDGLRDYARAWWQFRPRSIECPACGQRMWENGTPAGEVYCSSECDWYSHGALSEEKYQAFLLGRSE